MSETNRLCMSNRISALADLLTLNSATAASFHAHAVTVASMTSRIHLRDSEYWIEGYRSLGIDDETAHDLYHSGIDAFVISTLMNRSKVSETFLEALDPSEQDIIDNILAKRDIKLSL